MYDAVKLRQAGGFNFWQDLPTWHSGEDVLAQLRVMRAYGGCGLIPSGVYHQELPTTVPDRQVNAPEVLSLGHSPSQKMWLRFVGGSAAMFTAHRQSGNSGD